MLLVSSEHRVQVVGSKAILLGSILCSGSGSSHWVVVARGMDHLRPEFVHAGLPVFRQPVPKMGPHAHFVVTRANRRPRDSHDGHWPEPALDCVEAAMDLCIRFLQNRRPELARGAGLHKECHIVLTRREHAIHLDEGLLFIDEPLRGEDIVLPEVSAHKHVLDELGRVVRDGSQGPQEVAGAKTALTDIMVLDPTRLEDTECPVIPLRNLLHCPPVVVLRTVLADALRGVPALAHTTDGLQIGREVRVVRAAGGELRLPGVQLLEAV
mmetsp:Transcript_12398/g.34105  ORF Transcript_12398/g.34105 Transcript_12398/m.34105 type:complete len:268 (+) Transcript_12398:1111-1914(+)